MREKLIELIGKIQDEGRDYVGDDIGYIVTNERLADYLIQNGVTIATDNNVGGKWIPVTERLPKGADGKSICELVVVYINCEELLPQVCTGWLNGDKWYLLVDDDDYSTIWGLDAVTHWMPLPEPPKEVE